MAEEEEVVDVEVDEGEEEEEDMVDPQEVFKEKCAELTKCNKLNEVLETCTERVTSKAKTTETCTQEFFDFIHCVDHCVAKNLLQKLK